MEEVTYAHIAEDVLIQCILSIKVDGLRQRYEKDVLQNIDVLPMYHLDDQDVAEMVLVMLTDKVYLLTEEGKLLQQLILDYLEENWNMYDVSMSDFEEGLETYLVLEDEK